MTSTGSAQRDVVGMRVIGTGVGLVGAALAPVASAATFTVTTLDDGGAGSLRNALDLANANPDADLITFTSGLSGTITLTTGQLKISESVEIRGPGAGQLSVSGNNSSRVFYLFNTTSNIDVTISGLTITGGSANSGGGIKNLDEDLTLDGVVISGNTVTRDGGGLWADGFSMDLTVRNSTITGNTSSADGGGVYIEDTGGPVLFENCVISNNHAGDDGGGVYFYDPDTAITFDRCTISGNTAVARGGGVFLYDTDGSAVTFRDSTFSGNSARVGGGVYLDHPDYPVEFLGVTISGNTATAGSGGGVFVTSVDNVPLALRQTTIADNSATGVAGGLYMAYNGVVELDGSIVAGNSAPGNADLGTAVGSAIKARYSLIQTPGSANVVDLGGNILQQDPLLGALLDNGGPTATHLPAATSPALDQGDPLFAAPPATDQRGLPRVANGRIDMGAVERAVPSVFELDAASYSVAEDGGTVTVTVSRSPTSGATSVDIATSNGTALAGSDYTAISTTLSFADGVASQTVDVAILDDNLAEGDETFAIALANPGSNAELGATASATATIVDVEAGSFSLSGATYTVAENAAALTVTVQRSAGNTKAASVDYATSNGTATAGSDYTATSGTLNFAAGQTSATFSVPMLDDALVEGDETFAIALANPTAGATIGTPSTATATISDVESGSLSLASASYSVAEGDGSLTVTVTRSPGTTGPASVDYATSDGTATAGSDYGASSGALNFAAGQTSASFSVPILDDALLEGDEHFTVSLGNPGGGDVLGTIGNASVTIVDDEVAAPGTLGFSVANVTVQENAGSVVLQIERSGGGDGAVSIDYTTSDGSATAPADYAAVSGTLSWADGDTTPRSIIIPLVDDALTEPAETFVVTLGNPSGGALTGTTSITVTIAASDQVQPPAVIPTLSEAGRLLLATLMALLGWLGLRRRDGTA